MNDSPIGNNRSTKHVFLTALELPEDERAEYLDRVCSDPEQRARILDLLRAYDQGDEFLASESDRTPNRSSRERLGQVGPYKLLQKIGEGGFGTVYMAEQIEPIRRRVAVKIVKSGLDSRHVIARFEAERQALALMDHPNIAKVFDAGTTREGRPYFVMELIKGVPITEYCDAACLDPSERLALFIAVCNAIQHAHQKGVIHRDLKPSNLLVTLHDGVPIPKVIDFGIAKAIDRPLTAKTLFTEFRQIVGTPEYMSPEQAEMSGLDVDTRADIYSLGVLLYELLTGTKPFDLERILEQGYGEMLRVIKEDDPPTPSTRVSSLGEPLATIAKQRRTEPKNLGRLIAGDLDWIIMRSLEKDRSRRYDSAASLARDIARHLRNEPVEAGPPGLAYRIQKLAKRHRTAMTAIALVSISIVGALALSICFLVQAKRAQRDSRDALFKESKQREIAQGAVTEATEAAQHSRRQVYVAKLQAAQLAVANNHIVTARNHLLESPENLRGWEWKHLFLATKPPSTVCESDSTRNAVSPDGKRLYLSSANRTTGQRVLILSKIGQLG